MCDNGLEFVSKALDRWAYERGVTLQFIRPGKPVENAYCESFNGKLRDECLNANWFANLADAQRVIEHWRRDYNAQAQLQPSQIRARAEPAQLPRSAVSCSVR